MLVASERQAGYKLGTTRNRSNQGCVPNTQITPTNQKVHALHRVRPTEQGADKAGSNCSACTLGNSLGTM